MAKKGQEQVKMNPILYAKMLKLMMDGTRTVREIADETGIHYLTACHYTRALHDAGVAHIASWETDALGRDMLKVFMLGAGKDAKRQKLSDTDRAAKYRQKQMQKEIQNALAGVGA